MAVLQREFEAGGFHVANDAPFQDERLSWEAKGVLGYLFSKPEDWTPRMYDIVQNGPCEKYKIKSVFEELEENGYMKREKVRGEDGTLDWEVTVSDHPRFDPGWEEPTPDSAHPEEDGGYNNTDSQSDGQKTKTESESARPREDKAVQVYHDVMPRRANNVQKDYISTRVEDLDRWREVLRDWRAEGYSPKSVKKMLDVYENGWRNESSDSEPNEIKTQWHG